MPHATIGADVVIGANGLFHSGVRIGDRVTIGDRVIVHANAVIGADGFSFAPNLLSAMRFGPDVVVTRIHSLGNVAIGDDVEIGACTAIDRGTLGDTVLGDDVKLDNLVQVGHNCRIGSHVRVSALSGFSGGAVIEDGCLIGGQVGVQNRVTIGRGCLIGGQSGVTHDLPPGSKVWGTPAHDLRTVLKEIALVQRLPDVVGRLDALEGGREGREGQRARKARKGREGRKGRKGEKGK